jgi:hypothetical protein
VLHGKNDFLLRQFLVQILGRTLPTLYRLNQTRPQLFPDFLCYICNHKAEESFEHICYRCPFYEEVRQNLAQECLEICKRLRIKGSRREISRDLSDLFLAPSQSKERLYSAGQLPITLVGIVDDAET